MVQLFYYETRGRDFKKLISYEGMPFRVSLFPNEDVGWALNSYWIVKIPWWRKSTAKILEVSGGHYRFAHAKVVNKGHGNITIKGQFKNSNSISQFKQLLEYAANQTTDEKLSSLLPTMPTSPIRRGNFKRILSEIPNDYFRLYLTTSVSIEDFHLGYSMTGTLEQGTCIDKSAECMQRSHLAVVKRKGY